MIREKVLQGLVLVVCFLGWDFYLKDWFYGALLEEGEPGLAEVALGYGLVFGAAWALSEAVTRSLGLEESDTAEAYQ